MSTRDYGHEVSNVYLLEKKILRLYYFINIIP